MRRAVITGVAGFIGSNLAIRMVAEGWNVVGLDDLSRGKASNLEDLEGESAFTFVQADVTQPGCFEAINGSDVECIVHLAAGKIPRYDNALHTLRTNYFGTENALEFARLNSCKCVIASTSDVYGQNPDLPFSESQSVSVIGSSKSRRWAYAVSKLFDEHMAIAYQDAYEVPVVILRFFGSYGPRQPLSWWGGPPPVFIDAVLNDREIPIHGDGMQTRSFTFVEDTINGVYAAIDKSEANGEIINIGSNEETTILGLAQTIKEVSDTPGELLYELVPYESFNGKRYDDVRRRVPDTRLCEKLLGVRAQVALKEGVRRTIEWQRGRPLQQNG